MATFSDWYNDAIARHHWKPVAENAQRQARYNDPGSQVRFQDDIATNQPATQDSYDSVCLKHCLTGEPITAPIPDVLSRVISGPALVLGLRDSVGYSPVSPVFRHQPNDRQWRRLDEMIASEEDADAMLYVPARALDSSRPSHRAVFATFDPEDKVEPDGPVSRFFDRVQPADGASETAADKAVYRLALEDRPKAGEPTDTKVLLAYQRDSVGDKMYPVPPDAGFHPRFRAITPSDTVNYGRTFPDGSDSSDHAAGHCGENEIVHPNDGIPLSEVYVRSLGPTSCIAS